jgi:hypothetical protein
MANQQAQFKAMALNGNTQGIKAKVADATISASNHALSVKLTTN